ncbi:hypothetical protein Q2941_35655 [Bradyrhizobium sp. UFLA05-153]
MNEDPECEHESDAVRPPVAKRTSRARTLTEIRSVARSHTRTAIKLLVWDKVLGLGRTDALAGFASVTANLVVSFYFAKRGFENVARIIKR